MTTLWCASYFSLMPRRIEMVSSTDGWLTNTCWNRRSRAASFSMYLRYSSSVVAPIMRSSPRASIGLSMLPASMAPSPLAPAPTTVCSSSMKVMIWPSLPLISSSTAFSRSSNSPRYFAPATIAPRSRAMRRLALQRRRHVAFDDALRQALDDGRLADARLADQHRVVLGAARQHLDGAADLLVAADDGIDLPLARTRGEVDAELLECLEGLLRVLGSSPVRSPHLVEGVHQRGRGGTVLREPVADARAAVLRERDEQVLGADELVAALLGERLRRVDDLVRRLAELGRRDAGPRGRGQRGQRAPDLVGEAGDVDPDGGSSAVAMPSPCWSRESSRCSGSTCGLPFAAAMRTAAPRASWLLVVNWMSIALSPVVRRATCAAPVATRPGPSTAAPCGTRPRASQGRHLGLELEDPPDPLEGQALSGQVRDLAQPCDVVRRVQAVAAAHPGRGDQAEPVVLPQGLRVQPGELTRPPRSRRPVRRRRR